MKKLKRAPVPQLEMSVRNERTTQLTELQRMFDNYSGATDALNAVAGELRKLPREQLLWLYYAKFGIPGYLQHMEAIGQNEIIRAILTGFLKYIKGRTLDISCGPGEMIAHLKGHIKENKIEVVANDFTPSMIEHARKNLRDIFSKKRIRFTEFDIRDLPFKEEFDTIICTQTLHLLPADRGTNNQKIGSFRRMKEALKPGGHLVLGDEEKWKITQTTEIEPVRGILNLAATPFEDLEVFLQRVIPEILELKLLEYQRHQNSKQPNGTLIGAVYKKPD